MEQFRELHTHGGRIAAILHVPAATPAPGIVMCHGFTGNRVEAHFLFVKAARALCEAGWNVLRFDFRGSGESEGRFRDMTIDGEIDDALAALGALRAEPTVDPERVALIGLSLGGLVAACAAGRDGNVRALVLWSAVAEMAELVNRRWRMPVDERQFDPRGYYEHGAHEIGSGFLLDCARIHPLEEIAGHAGPTLVIHGGNDLAVPLQHARRYMATIPSDDARLHVIDGADHTFSTVALEHRVIGLTRDWLAERL